VVARGIVVWSDWVVGVVTSRVAVSQCVARLAVLSLCCGGFCVVTWSGVGDGLAPGTVVCVCGVGFSEVMMPLPIWAVAWLTGDMFLFLYLV
jgi:hypothetical protein